MGGLTRPDAIFGTHRPGPSAGELNTALDATRTIFRDDATATGALEDFYDPTGNYAGLTFLELGTNDSQSIEIDDLLAITLLEVAAIPHAVRQLLEDGKRRGEIADALAAVGEDIDLADADASTLEAAANLYSVVKPMLGGPSAAHSNRWVTAGKLCARKRPKLIPVRDNVVASALGLTNRDFRTDWLAFRHLVRDPHVRSGLSTITVRAAATNPDIALVPQLRRLDTVLWWCSPRNRR
ncbi:MAG: DUF6308 family protein [Pseudonocardiaceae bacterium]